MYTFNKITNVNDKKGSFPKLRNLARFTKCVMDKCKEISSIISSGALAPLGVVSTRSGRVVTRPKRLDL